MILNLIMNYRFVHCKVSPLSEEKQESAMEKMRFQKYLFLADGQSIIVSS